MKEQILKILIPEDIKNQAADDIIDMIGMTDMIINEPENADCADDSEYENDGENAETMENQDDSESGETGEAIKEENAVEGESAEAVKEENAVEGETAKEENNAASEGQPDAPMITEYGPEAFGLKYSTSLLESARRIKSLDDKPDNAERIPADEEWSVPDWRRGLEIMPTDRLEILESQSDGAENAWDDDAAGEERRLRDELERCQGRAERNPPAGEPELAMAYNNLASFCQTTGRAGEAEKLYCEALDIYRRLAERRPAAYEPYAARICANLAVLLSGTNRVSAAEWFFRQALDTWRRMAERHPVLYAPEVADACSHLGRFLFYMKEDRASARPFLEHALALYEQYPRLAFKADEVRNMLDEYYG